MGKVLIEELPSGILERGKLYFAEEEAKKPRCGFDEKEDCTRKCIYFDTCTRNPNKKRGNKEKSLY